MTDTAIAPTSSEPLPQVRRDYLPLLLVPVVAIVALPLVGSVTTWITLTIAALAMGMMIFVMASGLTLVGSVTTWITLTIAALAMGMMIFVMASGLTLVFGLMDVLNFGHGAFIAIGAYITWSVLGPLSGWT